MVLKLKKKKNVNERVLNLLTYSKIKILQVVYNCNNIINSLILINVYHNFTDD